MQASVARLQVISLLSRVPGRQRWNVPAIGSRPRLAAAVELALRTEPRVLMVMANPVTGTVLVKCIPRNRRRKSAPSSKMPWITACWEYSGRRRDALPSRLVRGGVEISSQTRHRQAGDSQRSCEA